MKLLINLCSHDGIISHYNGVGTMTDRYIKILHKYLVNNGYDYDVNLITPRYDVNSFGYSEMYFNTHKFNRFNIIEIENGSNGKINYGNIKNWELLSNNTAKFINAIDKKIYDKIITIYNDTPFAKLANYLNIEPNHITIWIPHSTIKIHQIDSAIKKKNDYYKKRLLWEQGAIDFINKCSLSYVGVVGEFITNHLIKEYKLCKNKIIYIYNGELLSDKRQIGNVNECEKLYNKIAKYNSIILSFSRAEIYKNLDATMNLGKRLKIPTIIVAQSYYKGQPIIKDYEILSKENKSILYIDPPFDFPWYILQKFLGKIIVVIPSKKEIMGLIINEVRKLNKSNILLVANDIDGLKEQIIDQKDGLLINIDNLDVSAKKIKSFFNSENMIYLNSNSWETLNKKYNLETNFKKFMDALINK